jgi:hypothetical protein
MMAMRNSSIVVSICWRAPVFLRLQKFFKHLLECSRHPKTRFVALHASNVGEDVNDVFESLDRSPNTSLYIAARFNNLVNSHESRESSLISTGPHIFDSEVTPHGDRYPQQLFREALCGINYRFLVTETNTLLE